MLVATLLKDIVSSIDRLSTYKDMSRDDLVTVAAQITTTLAIVRALTRSETNLKYADEELEEALSA